MPMTPFFLHCHETAVRETRSVVVPPHHETLPPGKLVFTELYCDERKCDCRRVLLRVHPDGDISQMLAHINFGWESADFYRRWSKTDGEMAEEMAGASLEFLAPQSRYADTLLDYAREELLSDDDYVERLKLHYFEFKAATEKKAGNLFASRKRPGKGRIRRAKGRDRRS